MTEDELRDRIENIITAATFVYKGRNCGIDPISREEIYVWYGNDSQTAESPEEALNMKLFDGKTAIELCGIVEME